MTRLDAICLAAIAALVLVQCEARGHEPGTEWMMDGGYQSGSTKEHCCSPNRDCNVVPDTDLELTAAGWRYKPTGEIVPERDTFRSRDPQGRHWRCAGTIYWYGNAREQKTRCLFVAPGTT